MTLQERDQLYTIHDLDALEQLPENADLRFELIEGVIYPMAGGSSAKPTVVGAKFVRYLDVYVDENNLGYVTGAHGEFVITDTDKLIPDAAFVSRERLSQLPEGRFALFPDLVVEVVSPTDSFQKVLDKARRYLQLGTRVVWIANPDTQSVDVCNLLPDGGMKIEQVPPRGTLTGGEVLPGFSIALARLFPD